MTRRLNAADPTIVDGPRDPEKIAANGLYYIERIWIGSEAHEINQQQVVKACTEGEGHFCTGVEGSWGGGRQSIVRAEKRAPQELMTRGP